MGALDEFFLIMLTSGLNYLLFDFQGTLTTLHSSIILLFFPLSLLIADIDRQVEFMLASIDFNIWLAKSVFLLEEFNSSARTFTNFSRELSSDCMVLFLDMIFRLG